MNRFSLHLRQSRAFARLQLLAALLLCGLVLSFPAAPAYALSKVVTPGPGGSCTQKELHDTLRELMQSTAGGAKVLKFDCGPQAVTIDFSKPDDGVVGDELITADITIEGSIDSSFGGLHDHKRLITLSGGGVQRIFRVAQGVRLTVRNLNFIGGRSGADVPGGAILNNGGIVNISYSSFTNNSAVFEGGAIVNRLGGSLSIDHSVFTGNLANTVGGAIYSVQGGMLSISHSTFTNNVTQSETGSGNGGAIFAQGTPFRITRTLFLGNRTSGSGGAISGGEPGIPSLISHSTFLSNLGRQGAGAINNYGLLTLDHNTFTNNSAPTSVFASGSGGAGAIMNTGVLILRRSNFSGNFSFDNGGALRNDGGTVAVSDTTFANNRSLAGRGGAISNFTNTPTTTLTIERTLFEGNSAGLGGGALFNRGNATVSDSTFAGNAALLYGADISDTLGLRGAFGGAILNGGSGEPRRLDITRSTFIRNSAIGGPNSAGGAIANSTVGAITIGNSTFAYNTAFQSGGALYQQSSATSMDVRNTTLVDNSAAEGASLHGAIVIGNSIIANYFGVDNCSEKLASGSPNLEFPGTSCGASLQANPQLGGLSKHGGQTDNFALLGGSPAIDAGDNAVCAQATVGNLDQRGHARPVGSACDLGAYERDSAVGRAADVPSTVELELP